ncbi:MAG: ABC transporter ATP-binding protein/permease [Gammaproteobacteria bacterium]|nr:ABC transporter ATP-binding protein/permease [Gammaproteobacteria bacterium]
MAPRTRYTSAPHGERTDFQNLKRIYPFIWDYRGRALLALLSLLLAKFAIVGVPLVFKEIIDFLDQEPQNAVALPVALLLIYGALRLFASLFNELRDAIFARVRHRAMHKLSNRVIAHLHRLSLRFHLERRTGAISRDLERGARSVSSILNYLVFNIFPTAVEFMLVAAILFSQYSAYFAIVTFVTVLLYVGFTLKVTEWRMHFRHQMNALDSDANSRAVDSLLNYETVKYFNNEAHELRRYDEVMGGWEEAGVKSQTTMSMLNFGQGVIIAVGVTVIMALAVHEVQTGEMSLGDLVLVNTMMLQLFLPLGFLGIVYRSLKYALADMDLVFKLLDQPEEIKDKTDAKVMRVDAAEVRFVEVDFAYQPDRRILNKVSFTLPAGQKVAVVGPSGAGKSTLSRLLFRFYDVNAGAVLIDGQDLRDCTQQSVRRAIGIVPQDTVLFNDSIYYNILYAKPDASREEVVEAAKLADIHRFIESLPEGYETVVGERGLKLSGGEKQRVAIARVILKRPAILVFDEATSSLDSRSEQAILAALEKVSAQTTTLVIAHRLSTIVDADQILVMEQGEIVERGSHSNLLAQKGLYAHLWALQQRERLSDDKSK